MDIHKAILVLQLRHRRICTQSKFYANKSTIAGLIDIVHEHKELSHAGDGIVRILNIPVLREDNVDDNALLLVGGDANEIDYVEL